MDELLKKQLVNKLIRKNFPISLNEYTLACKGFSQDTQDWLVLDDQKFYITDLYEEPFSQLWCKSITHTHEGFDVAWAFHENDTFIDEHAEDHYNDIVANLIETGIEDKWYDDYNFVFNCVDLGNDDMILSKFIGFDQYANLNKYPTEPTGESFFVNVSEIKASFPELDWDSFNWDHFGTQKVIFENDRGFWDYVELDQ